MNKKEKAELEKALEYLTENSGARFLDGLNIIYKLLGYEEHPAITLQREGKIVDIRDIEVNQP